MPICPACGYRSRSWADVASHMSSRAGESDARHVMWLNRNLGPRETGPEELGEALEEFFRLRSGLADWIRTRFIERFYGERPHPFMVAMQRPSRGVLLGYVLEHQHFLRNWARVLSLIVYKTDKDDVARYELENIATEFLGRGDKPSHYELLIRMGESLGLGRSDILSTPPLPATSHALSVWRRIAEERSWVEAMAAMHSLELAADRSLRRHGARMHYFNESILESEEYPRAVKDFLREGYEADEAHAGLALELVERYAEDPEAIQVTVLESFDALSTYLTARLERGIQFDPGLAKVVAP